MRQGAKNILLPLHPALQLLSSVPEESSQTARGSCLLTGLFVPHCTASEICLESCFGNLRTSNLPTLHFVVKKHVRGFSISDFLPLDSGIWRRYGFNDAGQLDT